MARVCTSTKRKLARIRKRHERVQSEKVRRITAPFFWFDASIRIGGAGKYHGSIFSHTGLVPTKSHLAGDPVSKRSATHRKEDLWIFSSPLDENEPIDQHIEWLLNAVAPHIEFLSGVVKNAAWADLCLGCLSNIPYPLICTSASATELIKKLDLELSFNFTCR